MWFKKLVGFKEFYPDYVRKNIEIQDEYLISKANGKRYKFGKLEIPKLEDLRSSIIGLDKYQHPINIQEYVGDIKEIHIERKNSTIQAASQFNLLEMIDPNVTPEDGIDIYEDDRTQGPICAIACGAGTIYRNYFVKLGDQIGQTETKQINCLEDLGKYFNNEKNRYWHLKNGYAFITEEGLKAISKIIQALDEDEYENLKSKLRIGIQMDTEVTISNAKHTVTQVYCSALPVGYSKIDTAQWESFARLILEGLYEATFYAAIRNYEKTGNNELYLTLVGGGVFQNPRNWIFEAIEKSVLKFKNIPLNVNIVSYKSSDQQINDFARQLQLKVQK